MCPWAPFPSGQCPGNYPKARVDTVEPEDFPGQMSAILT